MRASTFHPKTPQETALAELALAAREHFPPAIFWTIPPSADLPVEARNLGHQLEKHGGMPGLAHAARIEQALKNCGYDSWR